jgi:hypothetical protein
MIVLSKEQVMSSQTLVARDVGAVPYEKEAVSARSNAFYARMVLLGGTCIAVGILWDISWHRTIGRDTFWTPAHMAIYLGGMLGGFTCGWLVIRTTFFGSNADKEGAVRIWGFRGPLGAWVTIWGAFAMLTSAPFDNWWHDAYGVDVKILSPPHTVLALGMWGVVLGALLLILREQNLAIPIQKTGQPFPVRFDPAESFEREVPPHPGPLPQGEGEPIADQRRNYGSLNSEDGQRGLPLLGERAGVRGTATSDYPELQEGNNRAGQSSRLLYIYASGVLVVMASVFLIEYSWPNQQRTSAFYLASTATFPMYLMWLARGSKFRWAATWIALTYMGITAMMGWVLPLFPGQPRLGPIHNPVTHFVALPFPLLLVVPAFGIDLVRGWIGQGRGWLRDLAISMLAGVLFLILFLVTQWFFSAFLISHAAENWFFIVKNHWGYLENHGDWRNRFWSETYPKYNPPLTVKGLLISLVLAVAASRVGLWLGNWMVKVRR